jgi:hypothetical protein
LQTREARTRHAGSAGGRRRRISPMRSSMSPGGRGGAISLRCSAGSLWQAAPSPATTLLRRLESREVAPTQGKRGPGAGTVRGL